MAMWNISQWVAKTLTTLFEPSAYRYAMERYDEKFQQLKEQG